MADVILVVAEHRDGALKGISKEAMTAARHLGQDLGLDPVGVVLGQGVESVANDLARWGASKVLRVEDAKLAIYTPEAYVAALKGLAEKMQPRLILCGHSYQAIDFFPRLAGALDAALVPDVTAISVADGKPVFVRKVINGKLDARCTPRTEGPWLASLQQGAFPADAPGGDSAPVEAATVDLSGVTPRTVVGIEAAEKGEVDLSAADVIVAGGRGVGGKEKFQIVFDLADALGAAVGASRPPCDSEWVAHERQIGSSGQVVAPKLYFAVGISGAIQHVVGMRGSQCIVAINKDANAAIFQEATYGIVGDLHEVLPPLIEAIREAKQG
jgi:electron transfer flavoprotein alpha subunit